MLQFTAQASPWWLLFLVPAMVALSIAFYRWDTKTLTPIARLSLITLRCALLAILVTLAFRPNLILRQTTRYPGRVLIVLDDSRSMNAKDDRTPAAAAMRLARDTGAGVSTRAGDAAPPAPLHEASAIVTTLADRLYAFERETRSLDRGGHEYWDRAGSAERDAIAQLDRAAELVRVALAQPDAGAAGIDAGRLSTDAECRTAIETFAGGDRGATRESIDRLASKAETLARAWLFAQSLLDTRSASSQGPLAEAIRVTRQTPRLAIAQQRLARATPSIETLSRLQSVEFVSLVTGDRLAKGNSLNADTLGAKPGPTDIPGRLLQLAEAPSEFPLSAIVLVSDGRTTTHTSPDAAVKSLARAGVPVHAAMVGRPDEPTDVAIADVIAPPFAVVGESTGVQFVVKSSLTQPAQSQVEILRDGNVIATQPIELPAGVTRRHISARFVAEKPGLASYTARVASVPGEIFPSENNAREFLVHARKDPVRVLLLDYRPTWQTRFAVNVLQRIPYVDLNAVITVTQPDAQLRRGAERGTYPNSPEALAMYDAVMLGDITPDTLTADEWAALRAFAQDRGKTVCLLGTRSLPAGWANELAPTTMPASGAAERADELRVTAVGSIHPLTAALRDALAASAPGGAAPSATSEVSLLETADGLPVVSWRFWGAGRLLRVNSPDLWRPLNPVAHRAHQQLFVELITWAIEGPASPGNKPGATPSLLADRARGPAEQGLQAWAVGPASPGAAVEAVAGDKVLAEAPLTSVGVGALSRAAFAALPAGRVTLRLKGDPAARAADVTLTGDDDELTDLAADPRSLRAITDATGGSLRTINDLEHLLARIEPKERVETRDDTWRLWDARAVLAILLAMVSFEWVYRKFVGLA